MRFLISEEIFEKFPDLTIGLVYGKNLDNSANNEEIIKLLRQKEEELRGILHAGRLSEHPNIKVWREAFSSFGAKPKKYKSSVEALVIRVLKGDDLPDINTIVNIYNYISLKYMIPIGGDDIDKVDGDIKLMFAKGDEKFVKLGSKEESNPKPGEVVYMDDKEVTCRRWNWRECDKTKLTKETKSVLLVAESLTTKELAEAAVRDIAELLNKFCGGEIKYFILNKNNPSIELQR